MHVLVIRIYFASCLLVLSAFCVVMLTLMWLPFEGLRVSCFTKSKKEPNGHVATWQRGDSVSSGFGVRESVTVPLRASREKCAQHLADSPKIFKNLLPILGSCVSLKLDHVSVLTLPFSSFVNLGHVASPLWDLVFSSVKWDNDHLSHNVLSSSQCDKAYKT